MSVTITTIDWSQNQDGSPSAAFLKATNRIARECREGVSSVGALSVAEAIVRNLQLEEDFSFSYGRDLIMENRAIMDVFKLLIANTELLLSDGEVLVAQSVAVVLKARYGLRPKS